VPLCELGANPPGPIPSVDVELVTLGMLGLLCAALSPAPIAMAASRMATARKGFIAISAFRWLFSYEDASTRGILVVLAVRRTAIAVLRVGRQAAP
jgi:hypothetical protein